MKNILIFSSGAAIGSIVTWKLLEKKYKDIADEEIESVIEVFKNREKDIKKEENINETSQNNEDANDDYSNTKLHYNNTLDAMQYVSKEIKEKEDEMFSRIENEETTARIELITPEEFGEEDDYDTKSYTLYSDNILADELDNMIDDPSILFGDSLMHFGDEEDDAMYIRNTATKCDYEILKSEKYYN